VSTENTKRDEAKAEGAAGDVPRPESSGSPGSANPKVQSDVQSGEDKFRPEAIAARMDSIGEETDAERLAREEERKLLERKRQTKQGKQGLQASASKRLAKIGEGTVKRPSTVTGPTPAEADALLEGVARLRRSIRDHRQAFQALVTVAVLGGVGVLGWIYWQDKRNEDASAALAQGFAAELGQVVDKSDDDDDENRAKALYPTFKSTADQREAALAKYRSVEAKYAGTGAAILARLAEASLLLDAGDAKAAASAYDEVRASPLAQADAEVRGRALEGRGFACELLARTDEANADKHRDEALSAFRDMQSADMKGMRELGRYHEARMLLAKGDREKAIEILKEVYKSVSEGGDSHRFPFLEFAVEDRLRELDPQALPPKTSKLAPGPGSDTASENPQVQDLLRQLRSKGKGGVTP
jgi:hypothetical protein